MIPVAVFAAILFVGMAAFQATLALGAPLGGHVLGGRHAGALPTRLRVVSAIAAAILVVSGNTLGNLASKSRLERTAFAAMTAALAVLSAYVAMS